MKIHNWILQISLLLVSSKSLAETTEIKVLNWWDYTPKHVVDDVAAAGFKTTIITYRTNEMAISRLSHNSENFDIAVVSSAVQTIFENSQKFDKNLLKNVTMARDYAHWLRNSYCVPYFWSVTAFTYDTKNTDTSLNTLGKLLTAESKGYNIGIIDDLFEFKSRFALDYKQSLSTAPKLPNFKPKHFISSVAKMLDKEKVAVYGWHGESASHLQSNPNLTIDLGESGIVMSYDAVCVLKSSKVSPARLKQFIEIFTSKTNSQKTMAETQYFSPYEGHTEGLIPPLIKLREEVETRLKKSKSPVTDHTQTVDQDKLNKAWRKLRYGS